MSSAPDPRSRSIGLDTGSSLGGSPTADRPLTSRTAPAALAGQAASEQRRMLAGPLLPGGLLYPGPAAEAPTGVGQRPT